MRRMMTLAAVAALGLAGEDCSMFVSETAAGGPFNVMLVQKFTNAAMMEPNERSYNKVMAEVRISASPRPG